MLLNVMTYNIHHGVGTDKLLDLSRIAEVIKKSDADIIGLNEVDKHFSKRSNYEDQISFLADQLHMDKAFASSVSLKANKSSSSKRQYGNVLLSRYPIIHQEVFHFHFISGLVEGRSLLDTTVEVNKKRMKVYVTHLSINPYLHQLQINYIKQAIYKQSQPIILMGDFNMRTGSRGWKKLHHTYKDVWYETNHRHGYTYPSNHPRLRLDYIFVNQKMKIIEAEVMKYLPQASDHLPLRAQLLI
ncbi:endonuclease/exonuclease/phosphatase family protein [Oceanobacillus sp. CFH 90083]|uniref:endonuclease/exonuclease/phosphatase family protein n=1 Tax=Oceanobacillus sp. CFH 90083 TaxID=2592336 RepID=UPI001D149E2C|nr:endonuclease/exonuclease/phosphatase family protein [Oceanobacillus sp. CFH 90083]